MHTPADAQQLPPTNPPTETAEGHETATPAVDRTCPVCGAPLVHLRGQDRCSRCLFTFCIGCEDGFGAQDAE